MNRKSGTRTGMNGKFRKQWGIICVRIYLREDLHAGYDLELKLLFKAYDVVDAHIFYYVLMNMKYCRYLKFDFLVN